MEAASVQTEKSWEKFCSLGSLGDVGEWRGYGLRLSDESRVKGAIGRCQMELRVTHGGYKTGFASTGLI